MDGPVVTDFAHDVKACALGQASSSIMASHVVGSTAGELRELRETVRKMLKENGSPPEGKWADIALLEPVRDYKARHASTMLTFDAVVDAIGQIEARAKQPASAKGCPSMPTSCRAKAKHPVRREISIDHERRGVLDHPPSRMMTPLQLQTYFSRLRRRGQRRRSEPRLRRSWSTCPAAVARRPRRRN